MSRLPSREAISSNGVTRSLVQQQDLDPAIKATLNSLATRVEALDEAVHRKNGI